jgi:microcompartment protein CcmK/EutM
MIIGKVVGTVVASRKEEELVGMKFLAVSRRSTSRPARPAMAA